MFDTVALERSDVIAITEFSEQIVENSPVAIASGAAKDPLDMVLQVLLDCVVVEQRIVDIHQKNGRIGRAHEALRRLGRRQRDEGRVYRESSRQTKVPRPRPDGADKLTDSPGSEFRIALNSANDIEISLPRSLDFHSILGGRVIVSRARQRRVPSPHWGP